MGSVKGLHAAVSGVATGPDGRIWVFWAGEINGRGITAFTRSNRAVTRFEPIQRVASHGPTCSACPVMGGWGRSTC